MFDGRYWSQYLPSNKILRSPANDCYNRRSWQSGPTALSALRHTGMKHRQLSYFGLLLRISCNKNLKILFAPTRESNIPRPEINATIVVSQRIRNKIRINASFVRHFVSIYLFLFFFLRVASMGIIGAVRDVGCDVSSSPYSFMS